MQEAARSLDSANTEVHPRALIAQVRLPPQPRAPRGPCAGGSTRSPDAAAPPAPAFLAAAPADPARRSPRSSRLHGNQRAAGRPASRVQAGPGQLHPPTQQPTRGASRRLGNEPGQAGLSGPAAGLATALGAGTLLPVGARPLPAGAALLATAAATRRPGAGGPSDSSRRAPRSRSRSRPRRRRRPRPSIPAPGPLLASRR